MSFKNHGYTRIANNIIEYCIAILSSACTSRNQSAFLQHEFWGLIINMAAGEWTWLLACQCLSYCKIFIDYMSVRDSNTAVLLSSSIVLACLFVCFMKRIQPNLTRFIDTVLPSQLQTSKTLQWFRSLPLGTDETEYPIRPACATAI
jgi:hypothetical protein